MNNKFLLVSLFALTTSIYASDLNGVIDAFKDATSGAPYLGEDDSFCFKVLPGVTLVDKESNSRRGLAAAFGKRDEDKTGFIFTERDDSGEDFLKPNKLRQKQYYVDSRGSYSEFNFLSQHYNIECVPGNEKNNQKLLTKGRIIGLVTIFSVPPIAYLIYSYFNSDDKVNDTSETEDLL